MWRMSTRNGVCGSRSNHDFLSVIPAPDTVILASSHLSKGATVLYGHTSAEVCQTGAFHLWKGETRKKNPHEGGGFVAVTVAAVKGGTSKSAFVRMDYARLHYSDGSIRVIFVARSHGS